MGVYCLDPGVTRSKQYTPISLLHDIHYLNHGVTKICPGVTRSKQYAAVSLLHDNRPGNTRDISL
jgi:hypothetical protein